MDISAHLLSFFKELQRETGEEGDHREGGREAKSSHSPLVSKVLLPASARLGTQM